MYIEMIERLTLGQLDQMSGGKGNDVVGQLRSMLGRLAKLAEPFMRGLGHLQEQLKDVVDQSETEL